MSPRTIHRRLRTPLLLMLMAVSLPALADDDIWQASVGQRWFYETASAAGEILAGTSSESLLEPGNVYEIRFKVSHLRGTIGLRVGGLPVIPVDSRGDYSFDFYVSATGQRRMLFEALSDDVAAAVNHLSVRPVWNAGAAAAHAGTNALPSGHYWSFDRARNLETEMVAPLDDPQSTTRYRLGVAQNLHDALTTPGVRGIWMSFDWHTLEVADDEYDWSLLDQDMEVARNYGLKLIVNVSDRSFDGHRVLPDYFPPQYLVSFEAGGTTGHVAKRWAPYVYQRLIRLYGAIAARYGSDPAFGGIATTETALGDIDADDYSLAAYQNALIQIVTRSEVALEPHTLLFYLNFLKDGDRLDMNRDARIGLLENVPHAALLAGAPDITPDIRGMVRSVSPYRIHAEKHMTDLGQFCHLEHIDLQHFGVNVKDNRYRQEYLDDMAAVRERESQPWFSGVPAALEFDDVGLHPDDVLGQPWTLQELLDFGRRNFACTRFLWHFRGDDVRDGATWRDVRNVMLDNPPP